MTRDELNDPCDPKSRASLDAQQAAMREPFNPVIVAPDGRPARLPRDANCPRCGASAKERVPSSGFGQPIEVCQQCAYEFLE
jgi:hypothetical protein